MDFRTVKEAKVVYVCVGTKTNKNGEEVPNFVRIGIRVDMMDDSWWFYSFKGHTWTNHYKGLETRGCVLSSPLSIDRKQSFSRRELEREYAGIRHKMIDALNEGYAMALAEEAEKRAMRRAA